MISLIIRNTKKKKSLNQIVNEPHMQNKTVIIGQRVSSRGKVEYIHIISAGSLGLNVGDTVPYISDTGNRHGGNGTIKIIGIANIDYSKNITIIGEVKTNCSLGTWIAV